MKTNKPIPKYVQDLLQRRYNLALRLENVCNQVDEYCEKLGIDITKPEYADIMLHGHVGIYTEPYTAKQEVTEAILNVLNKEEEDV